jgi:hypothetical protein
MLMHDKKSVYHNFDCLFNLLECRRVNVPQKQGRINKGVNVEAH